MSAPLMVVGDAFVDRDVDGTVERVCPDAPAAPVVDEQACVVRPGGAGLAAALAAADGRPVTLVAALAGDAAGDELRAALGAAGVELVELGLDGTTHEKLRVRAAGQTIVRVDRGGGEVTADGEDAAARAIARAGAVLVADYGRGVAARPALRAALAARAGDAAAVVWDPHPRGADPVAGATVVTPNRSEAERFAGAPGGAAGPRRAARGAPPRADADAERAARLAARWRAGAVCVTRGADGAVLVETGGGPPLAVPATPAHGDPCGAGDRFASRLAGALADREPLPVAVADAVAAATDFVAAGGAAAFDPFSARRRAGAAPEPSGDDALALAERVRARGGTVVATGGCFDILHAGHVALLEAARALGDCLIVCLNSDASVRRLKGSERPLVPEADRAAVLGALGCVDAVVAFEEDTPEQVLERLRPHVWAKGGDYAGARLPEAAVVERWGGRAVLLPYVDGRSTTRLIEEVVDRHAA